MWIYLYWGICPYILYNRHDASLSHISDDVEHSTGIFWVVYILYNRHDASLSHISDDVEHSTGIFWVVFVLHGGNIPIKFNISSFIALKVKTSINDFDILLFS